MQLHTCLYSYSHQLSSSGDIRVDLKPDVGHGGIADEGDVGPGAVVHREEGEQHHHLGTGMKKTKWRTKAHRNSTPGDETGGRHEESDVGGEDEESRWDEQLHNSCL